MPLLRRFAGTFAACAVAGAGALGYAVTQGASDGERAPGPAAAADRAAAPEVSGQDRVYTADQTSNTVTVIDPSTNKTLGTIPLGAQRLGATLGPQYTENVGVHGLAYAPGHERLGVVSVTSNTVDIIDTTTNKVISHTDVGRAAHEGVFTQDGTEFWVADRGRDTVTVVDAAKGGVKAQVKVAAGPSKVLLSPDGERAYVNHTSKPEITVIDVATKKVIDRIEGLGDVFSSDMAISPDGRQIWAAHKRVGKVSVIDVRNRQVVTVLETGPDTNHPNFATTPRGTFAYLTIGGLDRTAVFRYHADGEPEKVTDIKNQGHAPHGTATSGDGSRIYVGLEKSDAVDVIDTATNKVIDTIASGQEPQAVAYAPRAAASGDAANLKKQGLGRQARSVPTLLPDGTAGERLDPQTGRRLEATVRPVSGLDMVQLQARGLKPNTMYQASAVSEDGEKAKLVAFPTDPKGNAPQVMAFTAFEGGRIAIEATGDAPATQAVAPNQAHGHGGSSSGRTVTAAAARGRVSVAELLYCDCC